MLRVASQNAGFESEFALVVIRLAPGARIGYGGAVGITGHRSDAVARSCAHFVDAAHPHPRHPSTPAAHACRGRGCKPVPARNSARERRRGAARFGVERALCLAVPAAAHISRVAQPKSWLLEAEGRSTQAAASRERRALRGPRGP